KWQEGAYNHLASTVDVLSVIRSEIPAPAGNRRSSRLGSKIKNSFRFSDAVRALLRFQVLGPKRATEQMARLVLNYFKVMQREDTRRPQESVRRSNLYFRVRKRHSTRATLQ